MNIYWDWRNSQVMPINQRNTMHLMRWPRAWMLTVAIPFSMIVAVACGSDTTAPSVPAIILTYSPNPQTDTVGGVYVDSAVQAIVRDMNGRGVQDVIVNWRVGTNGGSIDNNTSVTDSLGVAHVQWTVSFSPTDVGKRDSLIAMASGLTGGANPRAIFLVSATPASPSALVIPMGGSGNGQTASVGTQLGFPLVIKVTDQYANPVPNDTVTWRTGTASNGFGSGGLGAVAASLPTPSLRTVTGADGTTRVYWTLGPAAGTDTVDVTAQNGFSAIGPVTFSATATNP